MDERQLCQFSRCHAQYAFRLRLRHRLHHDLPRRYLQTNIGKRGDEKIKLLENNLLPHWTGISEFYSSHHCSDRESLLDGRADGYNSGLRRLFLQWRLPVLAAAGGSTAVGVEARKANSIHWRNF